MNQKKVLRNFSLLFILALLTTANSFAQRGRGSNGYDPRSNSSSWQTQETQQVIRIDETLRDRQQINVSRQLNLDNQRGMELVALKIEAEELNYRSYNRSQVAVLADQRLVDSIVLNNNYLTTHTIIIPQSISQARYSPIITIEVSGAVYIGRVTAVMQSSSSSVGGVSRPQISIKNVHEPIYSRANIPLQRLSDDRLTGTQLVGLRIMLDKTSHRSTAIQLLVNGRAAAREIIVYSGRSQSLDIPVGVLEDMVIGQDARTVTLSIDGDATITKVITRTREIQSSYRYR